MNFDAEDMTKEEAELDKKFQKAMSMAKFKKMKFKETLSRPAQS
jgi:hypothetical protein